MKRFLLFLLLLAIIIVVAVAILLSRVGDIVKYAVEEYGPKYAETDVQVEKVDFSLLGGSATIENFYIQNPQGFSDARLLSLGQAHFALKPTSLLGEVVDIQDITIRNPEFLLEVAGSNISDISNNNLNKLLENIKKNTPKSEGGEKPDAKEPTSGEEKAPKKLIVRNLLLEGAKVNVKIGGKSHEIEMPTVHLQDLGVVAGGITGAQLSQEILSKVVGDIVAAAAREVVEGQIKGALDEVKKNISEEISKGLGQELNKEGAEEGNGVGKAIEGLIPGF